MKNVPLRSSAERLAFCDAYFSSVGAPIVYQADDYREYELPRDVDKELTDRPYYWMWVEQTKQDVPPTVLRLAYSEEARVRENGRLKEEALAQAEKQNLNDVQKMFFRPPTVELMTLGSFRLDKIYASLDTRGQFCCVAPVGSHSPNSLVPWLMLNVLVSYRCDQVEQEFVSIGVCLANGQIVDRFYDMIQRIDMSPVRPGLLEKRMHIPVEEGLQRAHAYLESQLSSKPYDWAQSAEERLAQEIRQVRTYYQSILPDVPAEEQPLVEAERQRKERELRERTQPRIDVELKQFGLVGLKER